MKKRIYFWDQRLAKNKNNKKLKIFIVKSINLPNKKIRKIFTKKKEHKSIKLSKILTRIFYERSVMYFFINPMRF